MKDGRRERRMRIKCSPSYIRLQKTCLTLEASSKWDGGTGVGSPTKSYENYSSFVPQTMGLLFSGSPPLGKPL